MNGAMVPLDPRTNRSPMILGRHAIGCIGLEVDALDAATIDKVVDVCATPGCRDRVVHRRQVEARARAALSWSTLTLSCGASSSALGRTPTSRLVLRCHAKQLVARSKQLVVAQARLRRRAGGRSRWRCPVPGPKAGSPQRSGRPCSCENAPIARAADDGLRPIVLGAGPVLPFLHRDERRSRCSGRCPQKLNPLIV